MKSTTNKPLKILFFTKHLDGGTGTYVVTLQKLKQAFLPQRLTVKTLVLEEPRFRKVDMKEYVFLRKPRYYPQAYRVSFRNIAGFLREVLWFKAHVGMFSPDIVLSVDVHCNLVASVAKRLYGFFYVSLLTTHIDLESNIAHRTGPLLEHLLKACIKYFYNRADCLLFISKRLRDNFMRAFRIRNTASLCIYDGISTGGAGPIGPDNRLRRVVISVARLVDQKDHETLLRAFVFVARRVPAAKLWIVSDGEKKIQLQALSTQLHLDAHVSFLGWADDLYRCLSRASIFVLSSKREGFGYVLVEAMATGLPVISTDTPYGPSEIIGNNKYGILTEVGNIRGLSDAMIRLLTTDSLYRYYRSQSLKRARFFSEKIMLKNYASLIRSLIEKNHENSS